MANFHKDHLVIAADEENMRKVLVRIAENLDANKETTEFDIRSMEHQQSVEEMLDVVRTYVVDWYWLCFAGAPIDREVLDAGAEKWGTHKENQQYLAAVSNALGNLIRSSDQGVSTSFSLAPTARPMSESASVICVKYGDNWVLTIDYDTAWEPNSDDLNLFFMGLPKGTYGVAFLDADEYDGYESVNIFSGLHNGMAGIRAAMIARDDIADRYDLQREKDEYSSVDRSLISDLAELALNVAASTWPEYGWDEYDEPEDDEYYVESPTETDYLHPWGASCNWIRPTNEELDLVDKVILAALERFPWVVGSTGAAYEGREKNVERLVPGQPVKLYADWANPYFDPVAIQTRTASGERLGNLDDRGGGMQLSDNARAALACILPHVRAYADKVEPLMTIWDGRKRNSTVIVRMELTDEPLDNLLEEVHQLLKKASNRRGVSSVVEEGE